MMKTLKKIREFFWPLLERENTEELNLFQIEDIELKGQLLKEALQSSIRFYESEADRLKSIEHKSSLFIGTLSVATSILIGATTNLSKSEGCTLSSIILFIFLFILIIYFSRAIWFSVKALERKTYHIISIKDYLLKETDDEYYKKLITNITNKVRKNFKPINEKADYMMMAQEYFKRAIVVIVIYTSIALFCFMITRAKL